MHHRISLLALASLLLPRGAAAQNAHGVLFGAEASFTGGAVLATTHDPAGAFYNPAGLAALASSTVQLSGTALQLTHVRFRNFTSTTLPWARLDQTLQSTDLTTVPAVAAYGTRLSPRLGVAVGIWVPKDVSLGLVSTLHSSGPLETGGGVLHVEYAQQVAISQKIEQTDFGAAAGFEVRPGLRMGMAAFAIHEREDDQFNIFAGSTTDSTDPASSGSIASAALRGTTSRFGVRLVSGVQWDLSAALTLAAVAKTGGVSLFGTGGTSTVSQEAVALPGVAVPPRYAEVTARADELIEPWQLTLGGALDLAGTSLRAEIEWQAPATHRHGVLNGRVGVYREWSSELAWGAGIFTDRTAESASEGALAVDFTGIAAGLDYRPPPVRAARKESATWDMRASLALRYAVGFGHGPRLQANPFGAAAPGPSTGEVVAHALSVTLGGMMRF